MQLSLYNTTKNNISLPGAKGLSAPSDQDFLFSGVRVVVGGLDIQDSKIISISFNNSSKGSVFKGLRRGQKNSLKPSICLK